MFLKDRTFQFAFQLEKVNLTVTHSYFMGTEIRYREAERISNSRWNVSDENFNI